MTSDGTSDATSDGTSDELAEAIGAAILVAAGQDDGARTDDPADRDDLAVVRRAADADRIADDLLRQAISVARGAGHSWAAVGAELGMSRQAAQQRFGRIDDRDPAGPGPAGVAGDAGTDPEYRWLGPVTGLDEMAELEIAGRLGWHTVGAGVLRHRVVRTPTQWEHRRTLWASRQRLERDGWQIGCRSFPWVYLIRDTGLPAAADDHTPGRATTEASRAGA